MKIILQSLLFITLVSAAYGQEIPLSSHYFLNPYVYNPAYAGHDRYTVAFLNHRRQWMGIDGAPVSSSLTVHSPLNKAISIGGHIYTESEGLLTVSSAEVGMAYRVSLSSGQYLKFGLSAGMTMSRLDLDELQNADRFTHLEGVDNHSYLQGRFGIHYQLKRFNLGLALPSLFANDYVTTESELSFKPFENYVIMASYRFSNMDESFAFEPFLLYRGIGEDFTQLEATGVFTFNKIVWAGASYRVDYGLTGLAGVTIKDFISVGYAYELASSQVAGFTDGTHEINLSIKLGKEKNLESGKVRRPRFE